MEKKKKESEQAKTKRATEAEMKIREESVQKEEKRKGISVFVEKNEIKSVMITRRQLLVLMNKNVYFSTNNFNPSLYNVVVSILQEFAIMGKSPIL